MYGKRITQKNSKPPPQKNKQTNKKKWKKERLKIYLLYLVSAFTKLSAILRVVQMFMFNILLNKVLYIQI